MPSRFRRLAVPFAVLGALFSKPAFAQNASADSAPDAAVTSRLTRDVRALTAFPSRMPGTPSYNKAADYVRSRFREIGLTSVRSQRFDVTAPITKYARLTLAGRVLPLLPVYPNHVVPSSTPREGIVGSLVYAGAGRPQDYNGQKIEGAIVALDFDSGMNWFTAADLGARAIIFLAPPNGSSLRGEAEKKFASLPLEVPRYYATPDVAGVIASSAGNRVMSTTNDNRLVGTTPAPNVKVESQVLWERVQAQNIVGEIPGTDASLRGKAGSIVAVGGYFDSMSITPDLAPGAEAAGNMAALLEMARYFKANPPRYTLQFVATGAHHLALAGMRNWVAENLADLNAVGDAQTKARIASYKTFVGLDLTSRSQTVGLFAKSAFYNQMFKDGNSESLLLNLYPDFSKGIEALANDEADRRKVAREVFYVDGIRGQEGRTWRSYLPAPTALDSEVVTLAAKPGISFATANDLRNYQDTPFDTLDRMNVDNLARQLATVQTLMSGMMKPGATEQAKSNQDLLALLPEDSKFSNVFGYVAGRAIFREMTGSASFLPDTPIPDEQLLADENARFAEIKKPTKEQRQQHDRNIAELTDSRAVAYVLNKSAAPARRQDFSSYCGVRGAFIERATYSKARAAQGRTAAVKRVAQFIVIGPRVGDPKGGGTPEYEMETYTVSGAGRITYAPDMGSQRGSFSPMFNAVKAAYDYRDKELGSLNVNASNITFPCRATALFDSVDQRYFTVLREMNVLDAGTDANPISYGMLAPKAPNGVADIEPAAIIFAQPGDRFKLIMAQGLLGKRLVLLNSNPNDPKAVSTTKYEGSGFVVPQDPNALSIVRVPYQTARDLWILNHQRIGLLKKFGIANQRVDTLHGSAGCRAAGADSFVCPPSSIAEPNGGAIGVAQASLSSYQYDKFYLNARRAFGLESRAYPDVEATAQDVLKGIIFYLALLLPFSYFMERLLFGFPDIRKQIAGTGMCFLLVFLGIRYVHPAFELALTPFIILLAFIIFALTVIVTSFLTSKFEAEIKRLKQGVHFADVGRLSALGAALGLGIANMRRRPTRTALTCTTLILLTFTVLSFTSVTANISNFARPYGDGTAPPSRQGVMVRQPNWSAMPQAAVNSMRNEFGQTFGAVSPRAWLLARDQAETLYVRVANAAKPTSYFNATALCGFTPDEAAIQSPAVRTVIQGRWFQDGDGPFVCLLPKSQFERARDPKGANSANAEPPLGVTLDQWQTTKVTIGGQEFTCIGVYDDAQWTGRLAENSGEAGGNIRAIRDLDDEKLTPVDYASAASQQANTNADQASQQGDSVQVQRYEHMDATALPLLPYDTVLSMGGSTRSIAASFTNVKAGTQELNNLMNRAAVGIFGAAPDEATGEVTSKLYSSVESTSYEGFSALLVPIAIAALIIANTMLGSVFERTREIGIYSSIGLAPIHVAALFIAEAMVYAVLGSISGYLIAQLVAKIVTAYNLLPGITLNYSSSSAVIATLIVMATVLLSTLYPAIQAGRLSQPDRGRTELGEPVGDVWRLQFPFTVSGLQSLGMAQFLADFFETHTDTSVGVFYTDKVNFSSLPLRDAVAILNAGENGEASFASANGSNGNGANGNGHAVIDGNAKDLAKEIKSQENLALATGAVAATPESPQTTAAHGQTTVNLAALSADPDTEVYRLSMRIWLAPFDMGVSQDTEIFLLPSAEPGLNEMQLKLLRRSGEVAAWKRVNRGFLGDLRKQLLLWRTLKPAQQGEYILRGRAHVQGEVVPLEEPGLAVS